MWNSIEEQGCILSSERRGGKVEQGGEESDLAVECEAKRSTEDVSPVPTHAHW